MKPFKDWLLDKENQKGINEMPRYTDHDYLGFEPMETKKLLLLEKKWDKVKLHKSTKNKDLLIFINKRKTIALLGLSIYNKELESWELEVATWLKLDSSFTSDKHRRVTGVFTHEDLRGSGYTLTLYISLHSAGILLESDNEQYQGAKPLWQAVSRVVPVEVYDDKTKEVIYKKYDQRLIKDSEIWSEDDEHFLKTLRMKG